MLIWDDRLWIALSSSVILFNKWILFTAKFRAYLAVLRWMIDG